MEDSSLQAVFWRFLQKQNLTERTDMKFSAMAVPEGYQLTIAPPEGDPVHFFIGIETHSYLTSHELKK